MTLQESLELAQKESAGGIGTLGERTLHAALKYYLQPDPAFHEIKVGRWVADIQDSWGITEIQTRQFGRLQAKLEAFLALGPVTVVYPVAAQKRLCWMDPETGETSPWHRSPKKKGPADVLYELYAIRDLLGNPNLSIRILLLEMEEIRYLNGWSHDRKRGSTRMDRVPVSLLGEVTVGPKWAMRLSFQLGCRRSSPRRSLPRGRPSASPQPSGGFFFSTNWGWWTAWENRGDPTSTGLLNNQKRQGRK